MASVLCAEKKSSTMRGLGFPPCLTCCIQIISIHQVISSIAPEEKSFYGIFTSLKIITGSNFSQLAIQAFKTTVNFMRSEN